MNTSDITRQICENTYRPVARVLMTYEYRGDKKSFILRLDQTRGKARLMDTAIWAALHGVEIVIRPC